MKNKSEELRFSRGELEGISRNYRFMSAKTKSRYDVIMLAVFVKTIKGKLGFKQNADDGTFLFNAQAIAAALTLNTGGYFTPAFSKLALLNTQTGEFETAVGNVRTHVLGGAGAKIAAKQALKKTLDSALGYINDLARADQVNAVEIITGAKMMVVKEASRNKQDFSVKLGAAGEAKLACLAAKFDEKYVNATYYWQYSVDGGLTWVDLENTTEAKTVATGLTAGIKTLFRKRVKNAKTGMGTWSPTIDVYPR